MAKVLFAITFITNSFCFAQSFYWGAELTQETTNDYCYFSYEMPKLIIENDGDFFPNPDLKQKWEDQRNATLNTYHEFLKHPELCHDESGIMKFDIRSSVTTPPSSTTLVSILYKNWIEYEGPSFGVTSQVFDPIEGRMFNLSNLLIDSPENVKILQEMIKKKLKEKPNFSEVSGLTKWQKSIESLSQIDNFYVTGASVIIYLNSHHIGSPPVGVYEAEFFLDELLAAQLISERSVLIPLLKMNHLIE